MRYKPLRSVGLVCTALVLAVLSCSIFSSKQVKPTPESPPKEATDSPGDATLAPSKKSPPVNELNPTSTPIDKEGSIINLSQGLAALPSYRAVLTMDVSGKDTNDKDTQGSLSMTQSKNNSDKSQHILINYAGKLGSIDGGAGTQFETYLVGGITYKITPTSNGVVVCSSLPTGQSTAPALLFDPKDIIGSMHDAELLKKGEDISGIKSDHYKFDQTNLNGSALLNTKGEIWIAQDGGYVVKMAGTAVGAKLMTFDDPNAIITFNYLVDQVGKVGKIEAPKECGGLPADIPMPPNTTLQMSASGFYTLKSSITPKEIADFYRQQLPPLGWKASSDSTAGEVINLVFNKDSRTLAIMLNVDVDGTIIIISEQQ